MKTIDFTVVKMIRILSQEGFTVEELAKAFGISQGHVCDIKNYKHRLNK